MNLINSSHRCKNCLGLTSKKRPSNSLTRWVNKIQPKILFWHVGIKKFSIPRLGGVWHGFRTSELSHFHRVKYSIVFKSSHAISNYVLVVRIIDKIFIYCRFQFLPSRFIFSPENKRIIIYSTILDKFLYSEMFVQICIRYCAFTVIYQSAYQTLKDRSLVCDE